MKSQTTPVADPVVAARQDRFWKLLDEKEAILAQSASLRAEYDALRQEESALQAKQKEISDQFKAIEMPIYDIDMARSRLAQELGGKTGERPG